MNINVSWNYDIKFVKINYILGRDALVLFWGGFI